MRYEWDPKRNEGLKIYIYIYLEKIIFHLSQSNIWKTSDHHYQKKYPGQKIYLVIVEDYIYLVPRIIGKEYIFLKTIIPKRRATKDYQDEQEGQHEIR